MKYYDDNYMKEFATTIDEIFCKDDKNYVVLKDSIFYAQGGGQKGDRGSLVIDDKEYRVIKAIKDESFKNYLITEELLPSELIGKSVKCVLDFDFRYKQMKLHTSLHLLHCVLEQEKNDKLNYPILSNIEEDFAYNKYNSEDLQNIDLTKIEDKINNLLSQDIKVETYPDENNTNYRYWKCMNYIIPCGGIHVYNLKEIRKIELSINEKKRVTTIKVFLT